MLWRKTDLFWKIGFITISIMPFAASGCSDTPLKDAPAVEKDNAVQVSGQNDQEVAEEIIEIFMDFYETVAQESDTTDLEKIRSIISELGKNGYPAVDSGNQIDMVEAEQVIGFCETVNAKEENKITIIEVISPDIFAKYDLKTKNGNVDVTRSYYEYKNGTMQRREKGKYQAEYWKYTEDHIAFRVLPLDETCRELNRKYLLPIGYRKNNMFLVDWSEADFRDLNFYDLYDVFYPMVNEENFPYVMDDNLGVGAVYRIPKDEFEKVLMTYFDIDSETLQSKTIYYSEDAAYEYKPRGFYEVEYPEYPYPEVVAFTENSDGTITLTVHVVFPYEGISKVYAHEVVVRPLKDGGVQYVSNQIIPSEDNYEETWHNPRLSQEEGDILEEILESPVENLSKDVKTTDSKEKIAEQMEKGYDLPVDNIEKEEAEEKCKKVMELISGIYKHADKGKASNVSLSEETVLKMQNKVKGLGYPVTTMVAYSNMENYEIVDSFLEKCLEGKSGSVVIYEIHDDGGIGRMKYIFDGTEMYILNARAVWNDEKGPEMVYISYTKIDKWKYTGKG